MRTPRVLLGGLVIGLLHASWAKAEPREVTLPVEIGPISGQAKDTRSLVIGKNDRRNLRVYDAQDAAEHPVLGQPLREVLGQLKPPKGADTLLLLFKNGMQVPVSLADKAAIDDLFVVFEHADPYGHFDRTYRLKNADAVECPKVVLQSRDTAFSPLRHADTLVGLRLVQRRDYDLQLAQPTREAPTQPGWRLYVRYCSFCHGLGGQGATYAPDFITDMHAAYRRVPPLAETEGRQHPSLHDKVHGKVQGSMPTLTHVPNADIATIWRWLHQVHAGAVK